MVRGKDIELPGEASDEALMRACAEGDGEAFRRLFERYLRRVYGMLYHLTGDREQAQDLAQETFIRAWEGRRRFDPERSFRPWLFRIAVNCHVDAGRSWFGKLKRRTVGLFEPDAEGGRTPADRLAAADSTRPDRRAEAADLAGDLAEALACVPEGQRRALVLHDLHGFTAKEIGVMLNRPAGTVLSWLKRGRDAARARLDYGGKP